MRVVCISEYKPTTNMNLLLDFNKYHQSALKLGTY